MEFRARVDRPAPSKDGETQGEPAAPSDPRVTYPTMLRIDVRCAREGEICSVQLQLGSEDQKDWVVLESMEILRYACDIGGGTPATTDAVHSLMPRPSWRPYQEMGGMARAASISVTPPRPGPVRPGRGLPRVNLARWPLRPRARRRFHGGACERA